MRNSLHCALAAALAGAVAAASPASAAMRIGQVKVFNASEIDKVGPLDALLDAKLGHEVIVTGGIIERVAADRFLYCGYYVDRQDAQRAPLRFVIAHGRGAPSLRVSAPVSATEQERKGCWPGEREREEARIEQVLRDAGR